jgi:hypothetical protein
LKVVTLDSTPRDISLFPGIRMIVIVEPLPLFIGETSMHMNV